MKEKIISHIVKTVIERKKLVIAITILLCILSILSIVFLLKFDISLKGLAGDELKEVKDFNNVIRKFNVSGMISITIQPVEEVQNLVKKQLQDINNLIFNDINDIDRQKLLSFLNEYINKKGSYTIDKEGVIEVIVDMMKLLDKDKLSSLVNTNIATLSKEVKNTIINDIRSVEYDKIIEIKSLLKIINKDELKPFVEYTINNIKGSNQDIIIKSILNQLSSKAQISLVKELDSINEEQKEELIKTIDDITQKNNEIYKDFKEDAELIAADLKKILSTDKKAKSGEPLDKLVRGVLYSDELSLSNDRLMYMILVLPEQDISQIDKSRVFANAVDDVLNTYKKESQASLIIKRTGYAVIAVDEEETMLDGFGVMMVITVLGILLISFIGLKRLIYPILSFIPLIIGVLIMFGFYTVVVGKINIITLIAPILLFGVGIDYAIHLGSRYGEVRHELGKDVTQKEVLTETFNSIGMGLLIASLTTAASLLSLLSASIGGLADFAIMSSCGILFAFLSMIYILPIIVLWREKNFKKVDSEFLNSKKFTPLGKWANSWVGTIIAISIILLALSSIILLPKLEIETEKDNMKVPGLESVETSKEIGERYDYSYTQTSFIVNGYKELLKFKRELRRQENGEEVYPTINSSRTNDASRAIRVFQKEGWELDINNLDKYKKLYAESTNLIGESNETLAELYDFFVRNYVNWDTNEYLILVTSEGYVWYEDILEEHIKDINKLEENTNTTGAGLMKIWWFLFSNMLNDLATFSGIALVVIILILIITTKSVRGTIICLLTLIISMVSTLSIIVLTGIKINFVNIPAFPVIMGLGIDYTIHIYYRLLENNMDITKVMSSTGKAVLLTTLTTLMAFGTVSFSIHPGIAYLGRVIFIGISMAFISSIFVIPLLVKVFGKSKEHIG